MNSFSKQLPLRFKSNENKTFENFLVGNNASTLSSLATFLDSDESLFYLWGTSGAGKTHILQALCNRMNQTNKQAVILQAQELNSRQNVSLVEMFDLVCVDDAQMIANDKILEEALFFWINEIRAVHKKIIIAANISTHSKEWQLPDLISRIQSGRTHEIHALERADTMSVFITLAKKDGLILESKIIKYIENNCPMNLKFLANLIKKMDQMTLAEKKQLTIPFLKKILQTELV
ncbi:MAG TPA: hypothetical protein ENJ44_01375 [Oceanospirillales bacterium]|nr:hypothetical protein [Oceanospirillales bacterium]